MANHAFDRPHQQHPDREKQKPRRNDRDDSRQGKDPQAVVDHRRPQRPGLKRHLDQQPAGLNRVSDDPDDPVFGLPENRHGVGDKRDA